MKRINGVEEISFSEIDYLLDRSGPSIVDRAVTAMLHVSPNGDGTDGKSWATAYQAPDAALDVASTDAEDLTLILCGPGLYDINVTGDPTWAGNYEIKGSHRNWARIKNDHGSATSVMKFTGYISLQDLQINCGSGNNNGVIINGTGTKGSRIRKTYFECENVTGAQTALEISGGTEYLILEQIKFHGVQSYTKGMLLNNCKLSDFRGMEFHDCLTGLQITNAASDANEFSDFLFHINTLALDIDAGNGQIFDNINFHECTTDVDDEVGDHVWKNIHGNFPITITPDNFTGVAVATHANPDTWTTTPVEVRAAASTPFRVVGIEVEANASEKFRVKLTDGTTEFADVQLEGVANANKREALSSPSGTGFIFNKGIAISASSKSESGSNTATVWLEIQEV